MGKFLKDYFKEISIAIVILGLVRQLIYYGNYNLPIKYFLGLSELWLIICDDLIIAAPAFFAIFLFAPKQEIDKSVRVKPMSKKKNNVLALFFILGLLILIICFLIVKSYTGTLSVIFGIILFLILFFTTMEERYIKVSSILGLVIILLWKGIIEIRSAEHGKYLGTKVVTAQKTYISNDTTYFIGKTDNYIFFHNKGKGSNTIIPTSLIIEMEIQSNYGK
jgi:cell division protein FtsW (lipid II flippase)